MISVNMTQPIPISRQQAIQQHKQQQVLGYVPSSSPPSQVFTRGTTGVVKTRAAGRERSPSPSPHLQQRSDGSHSRHHGLPRLSRGSNNKNSRLSHTTPDNRNYKLRLVSSTGSVQSTGQHSNSSLHSAGSAKSTPSFSRRDDAQVQEWREPSSTHHNAFPSVNKNKELQKQLNYSREPLQSQDLEKLHIKHTKLVVDAINQAQGPDQRIPAITNACESFDHKDEAKHNIELFHGAATALARLLGLTQDDDEIRMICAALEMVFRGSPRAVQAAYVKCGAMLSHLLRALDRCESGIMRHADISILIISKILYYLSRCSELRANLCRKPGMLAFLTRVSSVMLNADCRLVRIRAIANLANSEENKVLMYEYDGLSESVLRIAHLDLSQVARQHAGAALMDLAGASANQVAMANDDKLVGTLVKMVLVEKNATTRESVITALQNLAFPKENRLRLAEFKQGIVLEALRKALSSDNDAKARRRAAGALTNLVCEETAEVMGNHKGLLDTLAIVSSQDENLDVQTRASLALTKTAGSITPKMSCHEALLDALVVASLSKAQNSVSSVLRVKARDPENRENMARHPGILDTLADICVSSCALAKDQDNAIRSIMHLVNESKNHKTMCNKTILDALLAGANYKDPDLEEARDSAVRALQRLATEYTNRNFMARHPGMLVTVAKAAEREAKWEDAGRNSEHGHLAKPLLMSLLVAM